MENLFILFLKHKNAHDQFQQYVLRSRQQTIINFITNSFLFDNASYVTTAFIWTATKEGEDYWKAISDEWVVIHNSCKLMDKLKIIV
jgi:hypothetical protein